MTLKLPRPTTYFTNKGMCVCEIYIYLEKECLPK